MTKPRLFIGSSSEGLAVAEALQANLWRVRRQRVLLSGVQHRLVQVHHVHTQRVRAPAVRSMREADVFRHPPAFAWAGLDDKSATTQRAGR